MHAVASVPDLYVDFCEAGGVRLLVRLLGHDNGDIAGDAADLLRELTDADAEDDAGGMSRDDALILVAGFAEEAGLEALASRLNGFDETVEEEALGVQNILAAIEVREGGAGRRGRGHGDANAEAAVWMGCVWRHV